MKIKTLQFVTALISEMAKPTSNILNTIFYHGTSSEKNAKSIIKTGKLKVSDLNDSSDPLIPINKFVYMTKDPYIAYQYTQHKPNTDRYAYVFVIDNKSLSDIYPDEDYVGNMIYDGYPEWLYYKALDKLDSKTFTDLFDASFSKNEVLTNITDAGKKIMKYLTDKEKLELISLGANIANKGSIRISGVWRLDKSNIHLLKSNGSNFKELSEYDKTGKIFFK